MSLADAMNIAIPLALAAGGLALGPQAVRIVSCILAAMAIVLLWHWRQAGYAWRSARLLIPMIGAALAVGLFVVSFLAA